MPKKYIRIKDKVALGPKKKPFDELTPQGQYYRKKFEENPEEYKKFLEDKKEWYRKNKPRIQKQKAGLARKRSLEVIKLLGGKCVSCGESLDLNLKRPNLQLHHLYYDENDLKKKTRYGKSYGALYDVITMIENGKKIIDDKGLSRVVKNLLNL